MSKLDIYADAVAWLEGAVFESQKMGHVNLDALISDCKNASQCVQMLLPIEEDSLIRNALDEISISLESYLEILHKKKRLLDYGYTSDSEMNPVKSENNDCRRLKIAIQNTIVSHGLIKFCDVVGLNDAKQALKEAVVTPLQFPHFFTGGRQPWRRILLYGPPGTGKTRLAQAVASEINSVFYSVSSSDLVSSWVGESEKLIKELFQNARGQQVQSVIFIDEIDSICRKRNSREEEYTRRIKTELLKQMEEADNPASMNHFILLCATNCPWELDSAFLRRFQKRIYIPLPDKAARIALMKIHLGVTPSSLTAEDWYLLGDRTEGFSGSDLSNCTSDAMFEPLRELENTSRWKMNKDLFYVPCSEIEEDVIHSSMRDLPSQKIQPRSVRLDDFLKVLSHNTSTVAEEDLKKFEKFTINLGQRG
nr:vacuolar protein sorting-associated protein 4B-like [Pocillopora verrucosa]